MTKYFPKDDIIALAGQIVPEGYELREIRQQWIPADEDGFRAYKVGIVFGFEGCFWQHYSSHYTKKGPLTFLGKWLEETAPAWEVYYHEDEEKWKELRNEN